MTARRARRTVVVGFVVVMALTGSAPPVAGQGRARVLLISLPRVAWADVARADAPVLDGLVRRSAVASLSPRTIGPHTSLGEGYLSVGAGNRAAVMIGEPRRGTEEPEAGLAFDRDERFGGDEVTDVHARRTGARSPTAAVLHLAQPLVEATNDSLLYGAIPGAMGAALATAGRSAAVIANADSGERLEPLGLHREAALAVMDANGAVAGGRVGPALTEPHPASPFGRRLDAFAVVGEATRAWDADDVVLVEASDTERADAFAAAVAPARRDELVAEALTRFDSVLEQLLAATDDRADAVVVFTPASRRGVEMLGVFAAAGERFVPGAAASSATTRRAGYVTLPDIAPTVLRHLRVAMPSSMTGNPVTSSTAATRPEVDQLIAANERAVFRDRATGPVSVAFIVLQVVGYGIAAAALSIGVHHRRRLTAAAAFVALVTLAFPAVAFLSGLMAYRHLGLVGYAVAAFGAASLLAGIAWFVARNRPLLAPVALCGLGLAVLAGDVVTGGHLQLDTVFGYSPIVAGRFAGYGNLAGALVVSSAIVVVSGLVALFTPSERRRQVLIASGGGLLVVAVLEGAPGLGSDVGGILTAVPSFAVLVLLLADRQLRPARVALIGAATVALVAVAAAIDVARPSESRTHLGRLVAATFADGPGGLAVVFQRKAMANVSILTSSVWTYVIPVALAFLAFLTWRPQGFLRVLMGQVPGLRAALVATLVAGSLGFALNDSGVAVPAMMLAVVLPHITWLVVRTR